MHGFQGRSLRMEPVEPVPSGCPDSVLTVLAQRSDRIGAGNRVERLGQGVVLVQINAGRSANPDPAAVVFEKGGDPACMAAQRGDSTVLLEPLNEVVRTYEYGVLAAFE